MVTGTSTILIAGAGQLGSRYLQGLAACTTNLRIFVQDPDSYARATAISRWEEAGGSETDHVVTAHDGLEDIPRELDLAIVATTASVRPTATEQIADHADIQMWILEKVLAQSEIDLDRIVTAVDNPFSAWVNTWARTTPWYRQMRFHSGGGPVRFGIEGGFWGLACNSIHFLDLMAWWTNENLISVDVSGLNKDLLPSKRLGNQEITGLLRASYSGGTTGQLSSEPPVNVGAEVGSDDPSRMWIARDTMLWDVTDPCSSTRGMATRTDGQRFQGRIELQSERTASLVDNLIDTGTCGLTDLETSVSQHRVFLRGLLDHWRIVTGEDIHQVPIT